jgi:hypothetical protein
MMAALQCLQVKDGPSPGAGPPVAMQAAMPQANQLYRAGEQCRVLRRAKAFRGQYLRNLLIRFPLAFQP